MKLNKNLIISFLALIILMGCQSVKNTLSLKKEQSVDEFLIEKKNPLVLPPDYSELPVPKKQNEIKKDSTKNEDIDLSQVLEKSDKKKKISKNRNLEESISEIIESE
mgnify:CR=1 FL=1